MVDLETLGQSAGCVILSIGAVVFDEVTGELGETFYTSVSRASCVADGLFEDELTVTWWSRQSPEAQKALRDSESPEAPALSDALQAFSDFLQRNDEVWGNGADFDNAVLASAYKATGMLAPWKFWNSRCYRTLKNLRPDIKLERVGTHHNALDDAKTQAVHAIQILKAIFATSADQGAQDQKCDNCGGYGGFTLDTWTDPVSGPESHSEKCDVCNGSGIEPDETAPSHPLVASDLQDPVRGRFEDWAKGTYSLHKRADGTYYESDTAAAWGIWQDAQLTADGVPADQGAQTEREAFEKTMNDARFFPAELDFSLTKSPSGRRVEYVNTHLQSSWEGWQARAALAATPSQQVKRNSVTPKAWPAINPQVLTDELRECLEKGLWDECSGEPKNEYAERYDAAMAAQQAQQPKETGE